MLAVGSGGLDITTSPVEFPYYLTMPKILGVELKDEF